MFSPPDELVSPEAPWLDLEIDPKLDVLAILITSVDHDPLEIFFFYECPVSLPAHEELLLQEDGLASTALMIF